MVIENVTEIEEKNEESFLEPSQYESKELNKLFEALAKAQLEMEIAKTDAINPFYKSRYADLSSVVKASRPALTQNGLCVIQRVITKPEGSTFLYSRLGHSSGQWIASNMEIKPPRQVIRPPKGSTLSVKEELREPSIQEIGSYLTYLRRYMYASLTGVVASDEDDDGEGAMKVTRQAEQSHNSTKISRAQLQVLSGELEDNPEILEGLLKGFNIKKISDLPSKHYSKCIERIREIKRAKED